MSVYIAYRDLVNYQFQTTLCGGPPTNPDFRLATVKSGVYLLTCGNLTFAKPDLENFPCLALAYKCGKLGGTACPAMNGANEEAVAMYLRDEIGFYDIYRLVSAAVEAVPFIQNPTLEQILETDRLAREAVRSLK